MIFFVLQFVLQNALACSDVRLDKSILKTVPIMDQNGSSLCWSYAAAILVDGYRFSHGDIHVNQITSPLAAAAAGVNNSNNTNDSGRTDLAVLEMKKRGGCDHNFVSKYMNSTNFITFSGFNTLSDSTKKKIDAEADVCLDCVFSKSAYTNPNFKELEKLNKNLPQIDLKRFSLLLDQFCRTNKINLDNIPDPKYKNIKDIKGFFENPSNVSKELSELLDKPNPQPVAIAYCSDVLDNKEKKSIDKSGKRNDCTGPHVSVVVGSRKQESGKCEYLIRNSYGTSCNGYDWPCEEGQIWVDGEALGSNTESLIWLD